MLSGKANGEEAVRAYFSAGANGVAMRIAPHVLLTQLYEGPTAAPELFRRIVQDAVTTHGHPRAIVGALIYGATLAHSLRSRTTINPFDLVEAAHDGLLPSRTVLSWLPPSWFEFASKQGFLDLWDRTNDEAANLLSQVGRSLSRGSMSDVSETLEGLGALGEQGGSGTITAASAIYIASRAGNRPISGLLQAAFQHGADTDTLASMTGALLGAVHGEDWLGQLRGVQDAEYIRRIADSLLGATSPRYEPRRVSARAVRDAIDGGEDVAPFVDGRLFRVRRRIVLGDRPSVVRVEVDLEDGQTAVVDRLFRQAPPRELMRVAEIATPHASAVVEATTKPVDVGSERAAEARVTLPAADLEAIAAFYSAALGRPLTVVNEALSVTHSLNFVKGTSAPALWSADAQIWLRVADLKAAAARLSKSVKRSGTEQLVLAIDPDGRPVTLTG